MLKGYINRTTLGTKRFALTQKRNHSPFRNEQSSPVMHISSFVVVVVVVVVVVTIIITR
jgi:hypothetical protein